MMGQPRDFPVGDGAVAALDFGGRGVPVVLVHGSGHNACAWAGVAQRLVARARVIALDLRGHGQTPLQSTTAEQYWRDLGPVCRALGPSVLVGHSTGGARPELVRQVVRRSFVGDGDKWLRRPTLEEIAVVSNAESAALIYPSIDLYDAIRCPVTFTFATRGFYTSKGDALDSVVAAAPYRVRIDVDANHNVPMTRPAELAEIIADVVASTGRAAAIN